MLESTTNQNNQCVKLKKTWVKPEIEIIHEIESGSNHTRLEASFTISAKGHKLFSS
jgi:hypothetical protein